MMAQTTETLADTLRLFTYHLGSTKEVCFHSHRFSVCRQLNKSDWTEGICGASQVNFIPCFSHEFFGTHQIN